MKEPAYRKAFSQKDFRGYFRWSARLTRRLGGNLYHACHRKELKEILEDNALGLRSDWSLALPKHGLWTAPGAWVGLNYFYSGNYYGPFLISFPLNTLNGRHFMVFRRKDENRLRYFFVQYEARIPIYSYGKNLWRKVDPTSYFSGDDYTLDLKPGAIYDVIVTEALQLGEAEIEAVNHPWCISEKCDGLSASKAQDILEKVAREEFKSWLKQSVGYRKLLSQFPILEGASIKLFSTQDR